MFPSAKSNEELHFGTFCSNVKLRVVTTTVGKDTSGSGGLVSIEHRKRPRAAPRWVGVSTHTAVLSALEPREETMGRGSGVQG
jgi:hypothetical protein